jgi:hypothetical protein
MVSVNILNNHKADSELKESRIQKITHLAVFLIKQWQYSIDFFFFIITN